MWQGTRLGPVCRVPFQACFRQSLSSTRAGSQGCGAGHPLSTVPFTHLLSTALRDVELLAMAQESNRAGQTPRPH